MSQGGVYSPDMPSDAFRYMGRWHIQMDGFDTFEDAQNAAWDYDGWPAWINGEYVVRVGCYGSEGEAEDALAELGISSAYTECSSNTGVLVTVTKTTQVLFEFDCQGILSLGVRPNNRGGVPITWFKGYKYRGGFSYPRVSPHSKLNSVSSSITVWTCGIICLWCSLLIFVVIITVRRMMPRTAWATTSC